MNVEVRVATSKCSLVDWTYHRQQMDISKGRVFLFYKPVSLPPPNDVVYDANAGGI